MDRKKKYRISDIMMTLFYITSILVIVLGILFMTGAVNFRHEEDPDPIQSYTRYSIDYDTKGYGDKSDVLFSCVSGAAEYDEVSFTIEVQNKDYYLSGVKLSYEGAEENEYLEPSEGAYHFIMPPADVVVLVYLWQSPEVG